MLEVGPLLAETLATPRYATGFCAPLMTPEHVSAGMPDQLLAWLTERNAPELGRFLIDGAKLGTDAGFAGRNRFGPRKTSIQTS